MTFAIKLSVHHQPWVAQVPAWPVSLLNETFRKLKSKKATTTKSKTTTTTKPATKPTCKTGSKDLCSLAIGQFDDAVDQGEIGKVLFIILQDPGTDFVLTCLLERYEPLVAM
jgi:hypothetical protein